MRTVWEFRPGLVGYDGGITDLLLRGDRLFYACGSEAGCINKATGRLVWRFPFVGLQQAATTLHSAYDYWKLAADDRFVYTMEGRWSGNTPPSAYHLRALRIDSGTLAWERSLKAGASSAPYPSGDMLLMPLDDGTVLAANRADGKTVWNRRFTNSGSRDAEIVLQAVGKIAVAQIGARRISAFHVRNGDSIWSYPRSPSTPDDGTSAGPAVKDGVVYALLNDNDLIAIRAATGARIWERHANGYGTPSAAVAPVGDNIVTSPHADMVAVRREDGRTVWTGDPQLQWSVRSGPMSLPWRTVSPSDNRPGQALFEVVDCPPVMNGAPTQVRSVLSTETLVMLDASTGREQWRWQPPAGFRLDKIVSDGERLYVSDGSSLRAVEPGSSDPLPTARAQRRDMAQRMVFALFNWATANAQMNGNYPVMGTYRSQTEPAAADEAKLTLLRLGVDAVPSLIAFLRYEVAERDKRLPDPGHVEYRITSFPDHLSDALSLLSDIGDRSCVPDVIDELGRAKNPVSRKLLAEGLIRLGDTRALPALLRYAQTSPNDDNARVDALYWVCRATNQTPLEDQMTAYLLASLKDKRAPAWLRLFARFELLNNHGENARKTALATFVGANAKMALPPARNDEDGIYQAAVEALCQAGRSLSCGAGRLSVTKPIRYGGSSKPLVLRLPPGSARINIVGHPGPVVTGLPPRKNASMNELLSGSIPSDHFCRPHIDLAGLYHDLDERRRGLYESRQDPFIPYNSAGGARSANVQPFRDYFPYVRSADGNRARVGWEQTLGGIVESSEAGFDVEVRKIGGRWFPVECRLVYTSGRNLQEKAVIPRVSIVRHWKAFSGSSSRNSTK